MDIRRLCTWHAGRAFLVAGGLISGCSPASKPSANRPPQPGSSRYLREQAVREGRAPAVPGKVPEARHVADLKQHDNGPGIIVCEPVAEGSPRPIRDFGAGCSRWLHFQVAGHHELGKTPIWDNINDVMIRIDQRRGAVTVDEAAGLSRSLGITHAAVGRITGGTQQCVLEYRLYEIPAKKPVGEPLKASGTFAQVVAQLPGMGRELTTRLGVSEPRVATRVMESASDLEFLGGLPRPQFSDLTQQQVGRLARLSQNSPLGAMFFVIDGLRNGAAEVGQRSQRLLGLAPDHPVAWGTIGLCSYNSSANTSIQAPLREAEAAAAKHPQNFQLKTALANVAMRAGDWKRVRFLDEEAARCATRNPFAWHVLGQSLSHEANSTRQGRTVDKINESEWRELHNIYPIWQEVAQQMVNLDPAVGDYWVELAVASTFASDAELADRALWKGIRLGSTGTKALFWGFEIYQPKWFHDHTKLQKVAETAAKTEFKTSADRLSMAQVLYNFKSRDAKGMLYPRVLRTDEERRQMAAYIKGRTDRTVASGDARRYRVTHKKKNADALPPPRSAPTGPHIKTVQSHSGGVGVVAASADARLIAAGAGDGRITLASANGDLLNILSGHTRHVRALAWSPDGKQLASGGADGTLRLWDPMTGRSLKVLRGHQGKVLSLAWHPRTGRVVSGGDDGAIRVWDPVSGQGIRTVSDLPGVVSALGFSPDGTLLAVSCGDPENRVTLRDGATFEVRHTLSRAPNLLHRLAWSPDGSRLATTSHDGVHIWDPRSGDLVRTINPMSYLPLAMQWSSDGKQLLYLGGDRRFHLEEVETGKELLAGEDASQHAVQFAWDPQGRQLVSGGGDGNVLHWKMDGLMKPPGSLAPTKSQSTTIGAPEFLESWKKRQ